MTDQDNLLNRIAAAIDRGFNESANLNDYEAETLAMAQAVIDEFGLHVETVEGVMDPNGDYDAGRVVGKWEKQCHR